MAEYLYNNNIINVPDGQTPPAGAVKLDAGSGSANAAEGNILNSAGGINGNAFAQAQAQSGSSDNLTIPLFRDRDLAYVKIGKTTSSANAAEHKLSYGKNSSANALENAIATQPKQVGLPKQFTQDQASTQFATILSDPDLFKQWSALALNAGLITPDQSTDAIALGQAWNKAVEWALSFKAASSGTVELTPFEAAQKVAENTGSAMLAKQAYAAAHFTGDKQYTQEQYNQQPAAVQTLHDLLGRDPSPGELAAYQHGVANVAAEHPTVTNTTTHYVNGEATGQTNVTSGGYDERQAEIDAASSASPEVAENQQATTYYNALVDALRAAV